MPSEVGEAGTEGWQRGRDEGCDLGDVNFLVECVRCSARSKKYANDARVDKIFM